jgi:DNA-binding response OmpR family regulator
MTKLPPCLLVIEQDVAVQTLLVDMLSYAGYDVHVALHTDDVAHIVQEVNPALVLLSGGRRGTFASGWRTAYTLKQINPVLPLLMLSTNAAAVAEVGRTTRGRLFVAGLWKPFDVATLLALVEHWCSDQPAARTTGKGLAGEMGLATVRKYAAEAAADPT